MQCKTVSAKPRVYLGILFTCVIVKLRLATLRSQEKTLLQKELHQKLFLLTKKY